MDCTWHLHTIFLSNSTPITHPLKSRVRQTKHLASSAFISYDPLPIRTPPLWTVSGDLYQYGILSLISVSGPLICNSESKLSDILWVFSHYVPPPKKPKDPEGKRYLTLAQNPHFYDGPPIFPTTCVDTFETQPTKDYQGTICVLTNNEHRVFLELDKKRRRTFDGVWKTNDILILKGSCPTFIFFP